MGVEDLLVRARRAAGLSQRALADRAGTSRPTVSAYEHGHKSPTLHTVARLLDVAGFELEVRPRVVFTERTTARGRLVSIPSHLPRLPVTQALATVQLPLHLNWSQPGRSFNLRNRSDRARVYEITLREGAPEDVLTYVDGVLLIDLWDELVLPADVRSAWAEVVAGVRTAAA